MKFGNIFEKNKTQKTRKNEINSKIKVTEKQPIPEKKQIKITLPGNSFEEIYQGALTEIQKEYVDGAITYIQKHQTDVFKKIKETENKIEEILQLDDTGKLEEFRLIMEKWTVLNIECSKLYLESQVDHVIITSEILNEEIIMVFKRDAVKGLREKYPNLVLYSKMEMEKINGMNDGEEEFKTFIRQIHLLKKNFGGWIQCREPKVKHRFP
jgi:hypothetical protein